MSHPIVADPPPQSVLWPEIVWLLPLGIIPLWVNFWSYQPFDQAKSLALMGLVWGLGGGWLVVCGWHMERGRVPSVQALFRAKSARVWMLGAVLVWAVVLSVATGYAVDWRLSLFGSDLRGQGLLTQLTYLLFFGFVAFGLRNAAQIARLYRVVVAGTTPLVAIGLLQAGGIDPFGLVTDARAPVYSTLGRANFTGAYLALVLPLTVYCVLGAQGRWMRAGWLLLGMAQILLLGLTAARAAWLSAAVGLAVMGVLLAGPWLARRARWLAGVALMSLGGALTVIVTVIVTVVLGLAQIEPLTRLVGEGSLAARLTIWQAVLELIRQRPWSGYGLENLELVFPAVYPPQLVYYQGRDVYVDRAHNLILDWMVAGGIPALGALVLLLGATVYAARQAWVYTGLDSGDRLPVRALLVTAVAVVAASVAGNLASFEVTAAALLTWAALGVVTALASGQRAPTAAQATDAVTGPGIRLVTVVLAGVIVFVVGYGVWLPLHAGIVHGAAQRAAQRGAWERAAQQAQTAVWLWPHSRGHWYLQGEMQQALAGRGAPAAQGAHLAAAETAYLTMVARVPEDVGAWMALGAFYAAWPRHVDLQTARAAYDQALRRAPTLAVIWVDVARLHMRHGDAAGARDALVTALDLDRTHVGAWRLLGDLYGGAFNDRAAAQWAYEQAQVWEAATR
ncbi:MAG: O-antigen ligase family protein [Litorilinea sp.]